MSPQGGGRNAPEWVAGMNRNRRPESIGISGRNASEYAPGFNSLTAYQELRGVILLPVFVFLAGDKMGFKVFEGALGEFGVG
jgi:hypothetical protein